MYFLGPNDLFFFGDDQSATVFFKAMLPICRVGLLLLASTDSTHGWGGAKKKEEKLSGKDLTAQVRALTELVTAQSARIATLEAKVECGSYEQIPGRFTQPAIDEGNSAESPPPTATRKSKRKPEQMLIAQFNVSLGSAVSALAVSASEPRAVVAADAYNTIHVYDTNGRELIVAQSAHADDAKISAIAVGGGRTPFVAAAATDGAILFYNVTLPASGGAATGTLGSLTLAATVRPTNEMAVARSGSSIGISKAIRSLSLFSGGGAEMVLSADASGLIRAFSRTGDERFNLSAGAPVTAMAARTGSAQLAVATETHLQIFDPTRLDKAPVVCEGSASAAADASADASAAADASTTQNLVSLVWEPQQPQLLYAASAKGETFVFNTRMRSKVEIPGAEVEPKVPAFKCQLLHTLPATSELPLSLANLKGYLVGASAHAMSVTNVTALYRRSKEGASALFSVPLEEAAEAAEVTPKAGAKGVPSAPGGTQPIVASARETVALAYGAEGRVIFYESKLPFASDGSGGLLKNKMVVAILLGALFCILSKKLFKQVPFEGGARDPQLEEAMRAAAAVSGRALRSPTKAPSTPPRQHGAFAKRASPGRANKARSPHGSHHGMEERIVDETFCHSPARKWP